MMLLRASSSALLFVVLFRTTSADAQEARPESTYDMEAAAQDTADVIRYRQFGAGGSLYVRAAGKGLYGYAETIDGYTILLNANGVYEYAEAAQGGQLEPSGLVARDPEARDDKARQFLAKTSKHLRYTGEALEKRLQKKEWLFKTIPKDKLKPRER